MKNLIVSKTTKEILRTHPISSNIEGWFLNIIETSNNAFSIEGIDRYGRVISKTGSDPIGLQKEIEVIISGEII